MHTHRPTTSRTTPFVGAIATASKPNPAAHGNIRIIALCRCGAERHTNANQGHVERGAWQEVAP
jgi:hypothetical protein